MNQWPIDWRTVVDEARRRRKQEGLSQRALAELAGVSVPTLNAFEQGEIRLRFERVIAILGALGMFVAPGNPDSFEGFQHNARKRWEELVSVLATDEPSRQPMGHSEQAYALGDLAQRVTLQELRRLLAEAPKTSGWPPFWISSRNDLAPTIEDGLVECWLGRPEVERVFGDAAHSDFWQVSRKGYGYLQRGYQEDGPDNLEPGTIFDLTLPIWRTAEVLLHAVWLARKLGAAPEQPIHLTARYTGLEGRELVNWSKPLLRTLLEDRHRARSSRADLEIGTTLENVEEHLDEVVHSFLQPLYERFDGYELSIELVAAQVRELRKHQRA